MTTTPEDRPPDPGWADGALSAIREMARSGRQFQAAELATEYAIPTPPHPGAWGRVFARAHAEGVIRPVGATQSSRRTVNKSLVMVWVGVDDQLDEAPSGKDAALAELGMRTARMQAGLDE